MIKQIYLITIFYGLGFYSFSFATSLTITQFDTFESASQNVVTTPQLELQNTINSLTIGNGAQLFSQDYRGETSFNNQSFNGYFWIEKSKDNHTLSSTTGYFESNVDECIESQDFYGLISSSGQEDVYTTDSGTSFRIGPYQTGSFSVTTGASGTDIMPHGWGSSNRAHEISFLTTGTHAGDSSSNTLESYVVTVDYSFGVDSVYFVEIPRDNGSTHGAMSNNSSGDNICNLGGDDSWCVQPHSDTVSVSRLGQTTCLCDDVNGGIGADDDKCWILEVRVALDSTQQINEITVDWTDYDGAPSSIGLNGPMALTTEVTEATYDDLFAYDGEYHTTTSGIDAGDFAIWYAMGWDQSNNNGEIRMAFDCGDVSNGSDFTSANWGEDNAESYPFQSNLNNPSFDLKSVTATAGDPASYQNHCFGRYAQFSAFLLDPFKAGVADNSPQLDSVTLYYALDADNDEYPETTFTGSNSMDCLDSDDMTFPGSAQSESSTSCMTDKDGDGYGSMIKPTGSSGSWVAGIDCDDMSGGTTFTTWYADCDGDGFGDSANSIKACASTPPTSGATVCPVGIDPIAWVSDQSDCNDNSAVIFPGADEICDNLDNDCNLLTDDSDPNVQGQSTWCRDSDSDTFGTSDTTQLACNIPSGFVANCSDCDDSRNNIFPGAMEVCDMLDNNCNDSIDDDDTNNIVDQILWCADTDLDTFGDFNSTQLKCNMPTGYVLDCTDCDDTNNSSGGGCEAPIFINGFETLVP